MEPRILLAALLVAGAVAVAWWLERRRPDAPAGSTGAIPGQLDRADFADPEKPWLVVLFSSATCGGCEEMAAKIAALESSDVAVAEVEFTAARQLHERYAVDAVPMTLLADRDGVVVGSFLGRVSATDLWAAVAEIREPGSVTDPDLDVGV